MPILADKAVPISENGFNRGHLAETNKTFVFYSESVHVRLWLQKFTGCPQDDVRRLLDPHEIDVKR
jgi:hypothetical protein